MKIGKEYINPRYVVHVSELRQYNGDYSGSYYLKVRCVDGSYEFAFGSKEFGNRCRNELISEVEAINTERSLGNKEE